MNVQTSLSAALQKTGQAFMPVWRFFSIYGGLFYAAFFAGLFVASWSRQRLLLLTALSLGITIALTFIIRYLVRRPRPNFAHTGYVPWLNDYSFPSAHASVVFSIAALESWLFLTPIITPIGLTLALISALLATGIAVSRVMLGVHYISDIVAGAILGTTVSAVIFYLL